MQIKTEICNRAPSILHDVISTCHHVVIRCWTWSISQQSTHAFNFAVHQFDTQAKDLYDEFAGVKTQKEITLCPSYMDSEDASTLSMRSENIAHELEMKLPNRNRMSNGELKSNIHHPTFRVKNERASSVNNKRTACHRHCGKHRVQIGLSKTKLKLWITVRPQRYE